MNPSWDFTSFVTRPAMAVAFAAVTSALTLAGSPTPVASAAPGTCAASEVARTVAEVATYTGNYLEANPKTDQAITAATQQQSGPESVAALKAYFDANPQVASDLQRLQRPLVTLSATCNLPITLPQVLGLMQAAQQGPAQPAAQNVGAAR